MLFTVEVRLIGDDLPSFMGQMRTWLDHKHCEPDGFRCSKGSPATAVRLDFKIEQEALDFADAFRGHLLGASDHAVSPTEILTSE
jgi:hypothetical protein